MGPRWRGSRSMKQPVFLTGATGFLGMEVLARLLEAGDREVIALVRASDDAAAEERLHGVLGAAVARSVDRTATACARWPATSPRPGSGSSTGERHGAGRGGRRGPALRGVDLLRPAARRGARDQRRGHARGDRLRARVQGARAPGALRARLDRVRVRQVRGHVPRAPARRRAGVPQHVRADQVGGRARRARGRPTCRRAIARPSIVMGESDTGWTPAFNVLYWPLRAFSRGLFDEIPALPRAHVDIVPGRLRRRRARAAARRAATRASSTSSPAATAPFANELVELACDRFDRPRPEVVAERRAGRRRARRGLHAVLRHGRRVRRRPRPRARSAGRHRPPRLADYFDRLMDYAEADTLGQAVDDARGGARAPGRRGRGGLSARPRTIRLGPSAVRLWWHATRAARGIPLACDEPAAMARSAPFGVIAGALLTVAALVQLVQSEISDVEAITRGADALGLALTLVTTLPLVVVSPLPRTAAAATLAGLVAVYWLGYVVAFASLATLLTLALAAAHTPRPHSIAIAVIGALVVAVVMWFGPPGSSVAGRRRQRRAVLARGAVRRRDPRAARGPRLRRRSWRRCATSPRARRWRRSGCGSPARSTTSWDTRSRRSRSMRASRSASSSAIPGRRRSRWQTSPAGLDRAGRDPRRGRQHPRRRARRARAPARPRRSRRAGGAAALTGAGDRAAPARVRAGAAGRGPGRGVPDRPGVAQQRAQARAAGAA